MPPELEPRLVITDRPGQAAQSLMLGDMSAAWRSMFQPGELTPSERDGFLKKHGLDKGPYAAVFRTLTNPLLIISLALSHKFPVPIAQNLFKLSKSVGSLTSRFPVLGRLSSMQGLFRGTSVPDDLSKIVSDLHDFRSRHNLALGNALRTFEARAGRLPNQREQVMVSAWLDGLHKPLKGFQGKNGTIRVGSGSTTTILPEVGVLMPNLEGRMGGPLLRLARDLRKSLDDTWTEVFSDVKSRKRLLDAINRQKKAGFGDDVTDAMAEFLKDPKKIPDYFPRRALQSEEDFQKLIKSLTDPASAKRFAKSAERKSLRWATPEVRKRQFQMTPDLEDLKLVDDLVDKGARGRMEGVVKSRLIHKARVAGLGSTALNAAKRMNLAQLKENYPRAMGATEAGKFADVMAEHLPKQYSLKLMPVLSSYNQTLAGTYAWTIKGGGETMMKHLDELRALGKAGSPHAKARADMLENTYIPQAMGRGTFRNALRAQMWEQSNLQMAAWMQNPKFEAVLGKALTKTLREGMESSRGAFSLMNMQRKVASYFYLSTLGLNPASALKNTLQLVLTTGPTIGFRTTAAGLERAFRKSHKYFSLRLGPRGMAHEDALRKAFPDFAKTGLVAAPITDEAVVNSLQNAYGIASLHSGKVARTTDKIQRAMMAMFTASETTVRVASFEAGMMHAARSGLRGDAAIAFSRKLVEQTQFLTGDVNTPFLLIGRSPLVRQLTQFPLRMLEFVSSTAMTLGSGAVNPKTGKPMNILGRNPGTLARLLMGSVLAKELGDAMDVDMGDALIGGALPTFSTRGPFAPFPIVPPTFQVVGSFAKGLATEDFSDLAKSTPLLVPGGVGFARAAGLLPPGVPGSQYGQKAAQFLDRPYADYTRPGPDGRIPVYTSKGVLRGYYRTWELVRFGLGVRGGDIEREQQLLTTLLKNRDQIRQARVQYLDQRFKNDATGANLTATQFKQRFGFDLPISGRDMEAMQARKKVTRLEQVVRTMPPGPARDQMVQLIAATLGQSGQAILGIDPAVLGAPKAQREAARSKFRGPTTTRFDAQQDLSPTDSINPSRIGRQRGTNTAQPPL